MQLATKSEGTPRQRPNRRRQTRYAVDEEAKLLLVKHGSTISCNILDLSLGGCRVRTTDRFLAGVLIRVEISFKILGVAFRLPGVTQWTNRRDVIGIRFIDMTPRRQGALAEVLAEMAAQDAVEAAGPDVEVASKAEPVSPQQAEPSNPAQSALTEPDQPGPMLPAAAAQSPKPVTRDTTKESAAEAGAAIDLINLAAVVWQRWCKGAFWT